MTYNGSSAQSECLAMQQLGDRVALVQGGSMSHHNWSSSTAWDGLSVHNLSGLPCCCLVLVLHRHNVAASHTTSGVRLRHGMAFLTLTPTGSGGIGTTVRV